ncbi:MAG: recombinase family protein [Proteobacteria bacterium]|nr:recombinase family protein [Pseudomonadota bacterium]
MLIGYARISTQDQNLHLQNDALQKAGCEKIFHDIASGAKSERQGLTEAINFCRSGDTLVVWKLDRLGRSIRNLIDVINLLHQHKLGFKSLQENIDTTTSGGKLVFHIFSALAEFERDIIRERTKAGLTAARARGRIGGRPRAMDNKKISMAKTLHQDNNNSIADICKTIGIKKTTLYKYLKLAGAKK